VASNTISVIHLSGTLAEHTYDFNATLPQSESIVSGRDVDTSPRNVWNARVQWLPIEDLSTEVEWQHVSSYWADAANANDYEGHDIVNFRATYTFLEDWGVALRVVPPSVYNGRRFLPARFAGSRR
jgi:iron complex outermembrane receptor protein